MSNEYEGNLLYDMMRTIRRKLNYQFKSNRLSDFQKNLTMGEQQVIMVLSENNNTPMAMKDMASELGISASTLTSIVDRLVERGLVKRDTDEKDRRKIQISLTKEGESLYKHIAEFRIKVLEPIFKSLTPQEIEALKSILQKIKDVL